MNPVKTPALPVPDRAPRRIVARTQGRRKGPILRLINPGDFGRTLKPFVFLDLFELPPGAPGGEGLHPHSGIATVTYVFEGGVRYTNTAGDAGVIGAGDIEWFKAAGGAWHGGGPEGRSVTRGFQLWLSLPPDQELAAPETRVAPHADAPTSGPAEVLLGAQGDVESAIPAPWPLNYLAVRLKAFETWRYTPGVGHTLAWLAVARGRLGTPEGVGAGELVEFELGAAPIDIHADEDCEFVIGSALAFPYDLALGYNSVHTSPAALAAGEARIAELRVELAAEGRLPGPSE